MAVAPSKRTPSAGIFSPGSTRTRSPVSTSPAGTTVSTPSRMTRAFSGESLASSATPARAFSTVSSSRSEPIVMIQAISPAAKVSPITTDAMSAIETRTSALMSKRVKRPSAASLRIGRPQKTMATQDGSKGSAAAAGRKLSARATPEMRRKRRVRRASASIQSGNLRDMMRERKSIPIPLWVYLESRIKRPVSAVKSSARSECLRRASSLRKVVKSVRSPRRTP